MSPVDGLSDEQHLVAAMLRAGFTPEETDKIVGGNYLRIFNAAFIIDRFRPWHRQREAPKGD